MLTSGRGARRLILFAALVTVGAGCAKTTPGGGQAASGPISAVAHLPRGCDVAGRADLKTLLAMPALKEHVAELNAGATGDKAAARPGQLALLRFLKNAGLDPAKDASEAAVCLRQETEGGTADAGAGGQPPVRHVVIVAGTFAPGKVLSAVQSQAATGRYQPVTIAGVPALRRRDGRVLAQASDGALVFGDSEALLIEALAAAGGAGPSVYQLDRGAIALSANQKALTSLRGPPGQKYPHPLGELLGDGEQLAMFLDAASGRVRGELTMADPHGAQRAEQRLGITFAMFKPGERNARMAELLPAGTVEALSTTKVSTTGRVTIIDGQLPAAALSGLFHRLALLPALGG